MDKAGECYYGCRSEIRKRCRDIALKIDDLRMKISDLETTLTGNDAGELFDGLASISHQADMISFCFTEADKTISDELETQSERSIGQTNQREEL